MTRAYAEAPATHYRLTAETWAIIAEEYKNGATAKALGAKWKVAPSSVYRYACRDGFTKKSMGDARARAHARMVEEEEGAARALKPTGSRALAGLFALFKLAGLFMGWTAAAASWRARPRSARRGRLAGAAAAPGRAGPAWRRQTAPRA